MLLCEHVGRVRGEMSAFATRGNLDGRSGTEECCEPWSDLRCPRAPLPSCSRTSRGRRGC